MVGAYEGKTKYFQNILSSIFGKKEFDVTTNSHGEKEHLLRQARWNQCCNEHLSTASYETILARDIEKMEGLGIYELTEEDVALL